METGVVTPRSREQTHNQTAGKVKKSVRGAAAMPRILLVFVLVPALAAGAPVPKSVKKQRPNFDGGWDVAEVYLDGRQRDLGAYQWWVAKGEVYRTADFKRLPGENYPSLVFPADAQPGQVDYVLRNDGKHLSTSPALFELDGDTLRLCYASERHTDRPTSLTPAKGNNVLVLKRVKDARK